MDTEGGGLDGPGSDDLSALAWVHGELRKSLETAHRALRRHLKEAEAASGSDVDSADPAVLRAARTQLHQGVGALELVGLPAVADVLRASEAAVLRMISKPKLADAAAVATIEQLSFALLDFLTRQLAGKAVSPLLLFPQYRAALQLAGAERIHPADLWKIEWQWRDLPADVSATPHAADDDARGAMETLVLALMRQTGDAAGPAIARMSDLCAGLAAGTSGHAATFWRLAAAVFEAQARGLLAGDVYVKRMASRLLSQLRAWVRDPAAAELSDRLAQDLLFFCSHARAPESDAAAPRLVAVRRAWSLEQWPTADYETQRLGRFDPTVLQQARKRVSAAKDAWSAAAGGETHRIAGLPEQFTLVGESLQRLLPAGSELAQALQNAISQVVATGDAPPPALAMEVATAMLYVDASLEDGEFDHPALAERVQRLARRIDDVRLGAEPQALDVWMEELYRRVSDRQTMGSVVQELRASLSEIEKQIDQYFRDPTQRSLLIPVPAQLSSMRGVLSVLGLEQASAAALHMRDDVDALAQTEVDPQRAVQAGTFDRLADNLGALSFLIDMLSVQPALAKSLFRFDPATGSLSAVMGQTERESAFAAFDDTSPSDDDESPTTVLMTAAPPPPSPALPPPPIAALGPTATGLEDDEEMRDIFIEEAREVVTDARAALERLVDVPDNATDLTAVRRAFHTLKGSSRMVGLAAYGEGSWACEQLYNARLAQAPRMDHALRQFTLEALDYLAGWTEAIAAGQLQGHEAADLARSADALRLDGARIPLRSPAAALAAYAAASAAPAASLPAPAPPPEPEAVFEPESAEIRTEILFPPALQTLAPDELLAFDFADIEEPVEAASAPAAERAVIETQTLAARVPGLPSAADLELGLPALFAPAPVEDDTPTEVLLNFDFDLGSFDEPAPAVAETLALPALPSLPDDNFLLDLPLDAPQPPPTVEAEPQTLLQAVPDAVPLPQGDALEIDLADLEVLFPAEAETAELPPVQPVTEPVPEPVAESAPEPEPAPDPVLAEGPGDEEAEEQVKIIGNLRIGIPLFNIYLNEADELSRRLGTELAEWSIESARHAVPESSVALAHSLAGSSATVGYAELSALARALEHALMRAREAGRVREGEPELFGDAAEEIRRLLHQFAAGFLRPVGPGLMERLAAHERLPMPEPLPETEDELVDAIDAELLPIFEEEADELLPQLQSRLRDWLDRPGDADAPMACMRTLHTLKGGARLAGALRLGEMAHRLETAIERLAQRGDAQAAEVEPLLGDADAMSAAFDLLRSRPAPAPVPRAVVARVPELAPEPVAEALPEPVFPEAAPEPEPVAQAASNIDIDFDFDLPTPVEARGPDIESEFEPEATVVLEPAPPPEAPMPAPAPSPVPVPEIDWSRFAAALPAAEAAAAAERVPAGNAIVRVRAGLLDRMVNQAGEVSITRARIDSDVKQLQASLNELTDSLDRMRRQLRDIELQAETQISTRIEAAKAAAQAFDPLEMDRFTRFQELTRFMAESVNDVATLQRSLQRTLQSTEDELAAQARLTRELQDDLLRTRMVEFESLSERLHRTVRQAARETGKQVRMELVGGAIEIDRGVLERMGGSFEHLLRNSVAHGVEAPAARVAAGKDATGSINVQIAQVGNEVAVEFADDGGGLDLPRIRQRAIERGLLAPESQPDDDTLAQLVFKPGFSTAETVTEIAGRGVGLDVVRAEVDAMGGRIETHSEPGRGTRFKLLLPLTTAVTQVVMLRCAEQQVAVPSTLVEVVRRVPSAELAAAYDSGRLTYAGESLPFFWLPALLRAGTRGDLGGRTQTVVVIRSAAQRVAVHVDEVVGNQEVVVKNVGPQLARMPGLAGVTLLPSGVVALIYNPVALATLYADEARERMRPAAAPVLPEAAADGPRAAMVLVVDDSLTVRRVTQRLLVREGYRVVTAKDGLDALERLAEERPAVLLSDIEMPRMDGFDLVRNVRADTRLAGLPVVMITSRIAQKHRDYAAELGVDHYLGKPYSEEELLTLVARYAGADVLA